MVFLVLKSIFDHRKMDCYHYCSAGCPRQVVTMDKFVRALMEYVKIKLKCSDNEFLCFIIVNNTIITSIFINFNFFLLHYAETRCKTGVASISLLDIKKNSFKFPRNGKPFLNLNRLAALSLHFICKICFISRTDRY